MAGMVSFERIKMLRKIETAFLSVLACFAFAAARQLQSLRIVPDPSAVGVRAQSDVVRMEWVRLSGAGSQFLEPEPPPCEVYYATSPLGGDLAKYTKLASAAGEPNALTPFSGTAQSRVTRFVPNSQAGRMGPGVYYVIAASATGGDTLYSDYLRLMVASADPPAIVSPKADMMKGELVKRVTDLAPVFTWKSVPGVPYYHIVLSDKPFINDNGTPNDGVNLIWQAITPNTRIAYGAPDPSGTVTASPPPLASGTTYSWMVLNNYGNRTEFTSWDVVSVMDGVAGRFLIEGDTLRSPKAVSPSGGDFRDGEPIEFRWSNLDTRASSYLVNILRRGSAKDFGMEGLGRFEVGLLSWETVVPRGGRTDALSVTLNTGGALTGGSYKWRVYALDNRGAAFTGPASADTFSYAKGNSGNISITTRERIGGRDLPVGYVELKSEVLSGPAMTPLLFYTGGDGTQNREFPAGAYRITAVKDGYFAYTATVTVSSGRTAVLDMPMSRPEAVLYGRALAAADSSALNAAKITAVSEWGDTVRAVTDALGGFMFSCRAADWTVTADKSGFRSSSPRKAVLRLGDNIDLGGVYLAKSPFAVSGVVRNSSGLPVIGARVRVLREGVLLDELASTPQNGAYVFYLDAGTYTLTAEKPGFAMFSRSVAVAGTMTQDITLREGAVLVSGSVIGRSWIAGANAYVTAPAASARVTFAETGVERPDTFTVTSDAVFGNFSVSLPANKDYKVTAAAAGFAASAAAHDFDTRGNGLSKSYTDTLFALATVKGRVVGAAEGVQIDMTAYDDADGRIIASKRVAASGRSGGDPYELRNIPDGSAGGRVRIGVGAEGYFNPDGYYYLTVRNGGLSPSREFFDFTMEPGNKKIRFNAVGYEGDGAVKIISPFNRTIPFAAAAPGTVAELAGVGAGGYAVGVVPKDTAYLELSHHAFNVLENVTEHNDTLKLPFTYKAAGSETDLDGDGKIRIQWPSGAAGNADRIDIFYRSEGSVRFESDSTTNTGLSALQEFKIKPPRDGCNLYYYFRVHMNGDIYGSGNRLYSVFVRPNAKIVSRVAVEPGVMAGDTLVMPSAYQAAFAFKAFYGDKFTPLSGNAGSVSWSIGGRGQGSGAACSYVTPNSGQDLTLQAVFTPAAGYKMKDGVSNIVAFTVRVTGEPLKSVGILRKGDAGPIFNNERVGFRVEAFDGSGRPVTVSPQWSVYPREAGSIGAADGLFEPAPNFVGMAGIWANAGGRRLEYTEPGAGFPGQRVNYPIRRGGGKEANTFKGMRVVFDSLRAGVNSHLEVTVPQLTNYVHRGTENYMMADSVAFDLFFSDTGAIGGDVVLAFDIPRFLRDAANDGNNEFRVARWFPDSLRWVPTDSARVAGGVVYTVLSPQPAAEPRSSKRVKKAKNVSAQRVSRASALAGSARYALVVKANKTTLALSVSPHPFSPYIIPVKEYGMDAKAGTCIKVGIQAPDPFVKSVKVRVYNATGKMVWGVEKMAAQTGENRFWWNGRTSGRGTSSSISEVVWSDDYYASAEYLSRPLCRNGRYYVTVLLTDMDGKQVRAVKPLVLMK